MQMSKLSKVKVFLALVISVSLSLLMNSFVIYVVFLNTVPKQSCYLEGKGGIFADLGKCQTSYQALIDFQLFNAS